MSSWMTYDACSSDEVLVVGAVLDALWYLIGPVVGHCCSVHALLDTIVRPASSRRLSLRRRPSWRQRACIPIMFGRGAHAVACGSAWQILRWREGLACWVVSIALQDGADDSSILLAGLCDRAAKLVSMWIDESSARTKKLCLASLSWLFSWHGVCICFSVLIMHHCIPRRGRSGMSMLVWCKGMVKE